MLTIPITSSGGSRPSPRPGSFTRELRVLRIGSYSFVNWEGPLTTRYLHRHGDYADFRVLDWREVSGTC